MDYLKTPKLKSPILNVYCIQIIGFCQVNILGPTKFSLDKILALV
jgi:hypothetical protein